MPISLPAKPPSTLLVGARIAVASLFSLGSAGALAQGSTANTPACSPRLVIAQRSVSPSIDRSLSLSQIESLDSNGAGLSNLQRTTGIYISQLQASYSTTLNGVVRRQPDGRIEAFYCLGVVEVTLTVNSMIKIAREFPQGGCAGREILAHELQHHAINLSEQNIAVEQFKVRNPLPTIPFRGPNLASAKAAADEWGSFYVESLLASTKNYVRPAQEALDSPAEYARLQALCFEEFRRGLASAPQRR